MNPTLDQVRRFPLLMKEGGRGRLEDIAKFQIAHCKVIFSDARIYFAIYNLQSEDNPLLPSPFIRGRNPNTIIFRAVRSVGSVSQ
jgi:hypothetical protein